ncbi:Protein of unknown function [Gryllus bimaculatus]|nr:Protein of unknown function [Gryllus bimaculatus]
MGARARREAQCRRPAAGRAAQQQRRRRREAAVGAGGGGDGRWAAEAEAVAVALAARRAGSGGRAAAEGLTVSEAACGRSCRRLRGAKAGAAGFSGAALQAPRASSGRVRHATAASWQQLQ